MLFWRQKCVPCDQMDLFLWPQEGAMVARPPPPPGSATAEHHRHCSCCWFGEPGAGRVPRSTPTYLRVPRPSAYCRHVQGRHDVINTRRRLVQLRLQLVSVLLTSRVENQGRHVEEISDGRLLKSIRPLTLSRSPLSPGEEPLVPPETILAHLLTC